ncbi:MAG TPA: class III extradiol ring-cleavage dioxygenase [Casimicrobiaceae bacterium]|nr:class III extradiol ring-cleavage dioxygenase [Casimicrobiaceae bacterium]
MNTRMPTLFLSHGSPMFAVEPGVAGPTWAALGKRLPRPRAVLMVSAHWETSVPMLTGNTQPETIHDFGGFPPELYRVTYPAPGAPQLAAESVALLKTAGMAAGVDGCRGLDHGAWVPMRWMYPDADVPVAQLSVQPLLGPAHHVAMGRALAPLTASGVLIIGSGHTTHNLRDWMANMRRPVPLPYVRNFSNWLAAALAAHDTEALMAYRDRAPEAVRAHPTDEHFLPLFVAYGAAGDHTQPPERFLADSTTEAIAMDSYVFSPAESMAHA